MCPKVSSKSKIEIDPECIENRKLQVKRKDKRDML